MNEIKAIKQKDNTMNESLPHLHIENVYLGVCVNRENASLNNSLENAVAR